jgi:hypothetical protein
MDVVAIAPEWVGLIGALGGVLVTGCVGLATAILNHRWQSDSARTERDHQQRESFSASQLAAYNRYLAAYEGFENLVASLPPLSPESNLRREIHEQDPVSDDEFKAAANHIRLVAGDHVIEAFERFTDAWNRALTGDASPDVQRCKLELIEAMRAEQQHGVQRGA